MGKSVLFWTRSLLRLGFYYAGTPFVTSYRPVVPLVRQALLKSTLESLLTSLLPPKPVRRPNLYRVLSSDMFIAVHRLVSRPLVNARGSRP